MLAILAAALVLDGICGLLYSFAEHIPKWHGLYCGLANGVTVGCNVPPTTHYGFVINTAEFLLVIPLFGATFGLFTGMLADIHIRPRNGSSSTSPTVPAALIPTGRPALKLTDTVDIWVSEHQETYVNEREISRNAARRLAILRHAEGRPLPA